MTCTEVTWDGWHFHECGKKAQYKRTLIDDEDIKMQYVCGIHNRLAYFKVWDWKEEKLNEKTTT